MSECESGDNNDDGEITINEILMAVNNALGACPVPSMPTASFLTRDAALTSQVAG